MGISIMKTFDVIDKATALLVYQYQAEVLIEWNEFPLAAYDHIEVLPALSTPASIYGGRRSLTPREFRDLFTEEEKNGIDRLRANLEIMVMPSEDIRDRIRSGFADYDASQEINLSDPRVPMLLGIFAGFDCIAVERIDEVLNG